MRLGGRGEGPGVFVLPPGAPEVICCRLPGWPCAHSCPWTAVLGGRPVCCPRAKGEPSKQLPPQPQRVSKPSGMQRAPGACPSPSPSPGPPLRSDCRGLRSLCLAEDVGCSSLYSYRNSSPPRKNQGHRHIRKPGFWIHTSGCLSITSFIIRHHDHCICSCPFVPTQSQAALHQGSRNHRTTSPLATVFFLL